MKIAALLVLAAFALTASSRAMAQCEPQRFWPDFEPRPLEFGVAVAINDEHLLVVDRFADKVYTYRKGGDGDWTFNHTVPGASGGAISLDGDRFLTGSLGVEAWGGGIVYEFNGERWSESGRIESFDDARWRYWGYCVTLFGDRAAMCNPNGAALLFREVEPGMWVHDDPMVVPSGVTGSGFGAALTMDGRFFVVGAPTEPITGIHNGAVYVYEWDTEGNPQFVQRLEPPAASVGPRLGSSLALIGDTLVVGAAGAQIGREVFGAVYVYERTDDGWQMKQELQAPEPEDGAFFGGSIAIHGDLLAIGATGEYSGGDGRGTVHLYRRTSESTWQHVDEVTLQGAVGTGYGVALDLASEQLVVGGRDTAHMGYDQGVADIYDLACLLCKPDLDLDGTLTIFDFLVFANLFQDGRSEADFDGDGELTIFDFLAFQDAFQAGCP
ncbi:MAG: GC-type dockerin domain-anchored protein [Phycisphaerales bacterium]